jgi:hypothetical protein
MTRQALRSLVALGLAVLLAPPLAFPRDDTPTPRAKDDATAGIRRRLAEQQAALAPLMTEVVDRLDESARLRTLKTDQARKVEKIQADLTRAQTNAQVAEIAVKEYLEGTFPQEVATIEGELALTKSELIRTKDRLEWAGRMLKKGVVSEAERLADEQAHLKAQIAERCAQEKRKILQQFTRPRAETELKANIEKAKAEALRKQAEQTLEEQNTRRIAREAEDAAPLAQEARVVRLLDELIGLHDKALARLDKARSASEAANRVEEVSRVADAAQAKADEARKLWDEARAIREQRRVARLKERIHRAATYGPGAPMDKP